MSKFSWKKLIVLLLAIALLVTGLTFSVSFAKWDKGNAEKSFDVHSDLYYVPVKAARIENGNAVIEAQPIRTFYLNNSNMLNTCVSLSNAENVGGALYFVLKDGYKGEQDIKSFSLTQVATDAQGNPATGTTVNNVTSGLTSSSTAYDGYTLGKLFNGNSTVVVIKFAENAASYVALDMSLQLSAKATCAIDVYFVASPFDDFSGTTGITYVDSDGVKHEITNSDANAIWNEHGLGILSHLDEIGKLRLPVTAGQTYKFYCENKLITAMPAYGTKKEPVGLLGWIKTDYKINIADLFDYVGGTADPEGGVYPEGTFRAKDGVDAGDYVIEFVENADGTVTAYAKKA